MKIALLFFAGLASVLASHFSTASSLVNTPIVVTATRSARTIDDTLAAVTVLSHKDIEESQSQDLVELLRLQTGIDISRNGGPGQQTSLFMRGTNSNHVLVLIDNNRVSSTTTGAFAWSHMPLSQIERIEIVRGPRATLYGSDAIGGIVHIFTRHGKGLQMKAAGGSYDSWRLEAGLGGGHKTKANIHLASQHTDGFSAQNSASLFFNPDDDAYDNTSLTAGLDREIGHQHTAEIKYWRSEGISEFDNGKSNSANQSLSAILKGVLAGTWAHRLIIGLNQDNLDTASSFPSKITSHRRMAEWQNDISVTDNALLTVGASHVHDEGKNTDLGSGQPVFDRSTNDNAIFAYWQADYGGHNIATGLRFDHHSTFGGHTTGQIAWGYQLHPGLRLLASYGTAFRSPSISELYHPGFFGGFFAGNAALRPETSWSSELGVKYTTGPAAFTLNVYTTRIEDLIAFQGINSQAINIGRAKINGLEINYNLHYQRWHYRNQLTLMEARDDSTGDALLRRPDQKLVTRIDCTIAHRGNAALEWLLSSQRRDVGNTELPGYGLVNLSFTYPLSKALSMEGKIENLFDKQYELAAGFNTSDRAVFVGLNYHE